MVKEEGDEAEETEEAEEAGTKLLLRLLYSACFDIALFYEQQH